MLPWEGNSVLDKFKKNYRVRSSLLDIPEMPGDALPPLILRGKVSRRRCARYWTKFSVWLKNGSRTNSIQRPPDIMAFQLDDKLAVTTKRRHVSTTPKDIEELRRKYAVFSDMWLLALMRQTGRPMH